jgi:hypothetical protein
MNIGILTYHCGPNFGCNLQAISTIGYLKRMGHKPIVLHWYPEDLEKMYDRRIPLEQLQCHRDFVKNAMPITRLCRTEEELVGVINDSNLDAIIVGSDALFKYIPKACRTRFSFRQMKKVHIDPLSCEDLLDNPFWGGFVPKLKKRIPVAAFSVSSQNCPYQQMDTDEMDTIGGYMKNFSSITVRDEWTSGMVKALTDFNNIPITPDPVFSFNQNCYLDIPSKEEIMEKFGLRDRYLLLSFSDWHIRESYIKSLADEINNKGYQPVALPMPEGLFDGGVAKKIHLPLSPLDWYALIRYSSGYIGERMHPIVVCLHNSVPFFCFDGYGTVSRYMCGVIRKFSINSSKTYLILQRSGFTKQLFSYHGHVLMPSSKGVVESVLKFDKDKCSKFSDYYQKQYEKGMKLVLNSFNVSF